MSVSTTGRVVSVNVGRKRPVERMGRLRETAIRKEPASRRLAVRGVNVEGDEQADLTVHGGPEQAVYAYAREDYDWWERELGQPLADARLVLDPERFGEFFDAGLVTARDVTRVRAPVLRIAVAEKVARVSGGCIEPLDKRLRARAR